MLFVRKRNVSILSDISIEFVRFYPQNGVRNDPREDLFVNLYYLIEGIALKI